MPQERLNLKRMKITQIHVSERKKGKKEGTGVTHLSGQPRASLRRAMAAQVGEE